MDLLFGGEMSVTIGLLLGVDEWSERRLATATTVFGFWSA